MSDVGPSINELELIRMPNANRLMEIIQPILNNIESLTLRNTTKWIGPTDAQVPNLKQLILYEEGIDLNFIRKNLKHLKKLVIR